MATIRLPDGNYYPILDGETTTQAYAAAMKKYPESFGLPPNVNDLSNTTQVQAQPIDERAASAEALFIGVSSGLITAALIYVILPKKFKATNPFEMGRVWLGWSAALFVMTAYREGMKSTQSGIIVFILSFLILGPLAFLLGWIYGKFFKFKTDNNINLLQTPRTLKVQPVILDNITPENQNIAETKTANIQPMTSPINMDINEDLFYEIVSNELDSGNTQKGLWTKLFAQCNGDETQTKVRYIEQRVRQLAENEIQKSTEEKQLKRSQFLLSERQRLLEQQLSARANTIMSIELFGNSINQDHKPIIIFIEELGGTVTEENKLIGGVSYQVHLDGEIYSLQWRDFTRWFINELLPKIKLTEEFTLEKLQQMELHAITYDGKKYCYQEFRYDNYNDALRYAEKAALKQS